MYIWYGNIAPGRIFTDESGPIGCFNPAETLVLTGTAGDYGPAGGSLHQLLLGFMVG